MPRYKLTIEYEGTGLYGWQRQVPGYPSVQEHVEDAVAAFYHSDERFLVQCAGRTDAGVHAMAQVAHVDFPDAEREIYTIISGLNYHLRKTNIKILAAEQVDDNFHARFGAKQREYEYIIINRAAPLTFQRNIAWNVREPLDVDAMHEAAQLLLGEHDFSSFRDSHCQAKSPIKVIDVIKLKREGERIITELEAPSYLHHQVRIIMGSLRKVGNGRWSKADFKAALEAKNRKAAGETAPPQGLFFRKVWY